MAHLVREHMVVAARSLSDMAALTGVDKATLSRSLNSESFSDPVRRKLRSLVQPMTERNTTTLLRKSLLLISLSDKLRREAERMLVEALDQSGRGT